MDELEAKVIEYAYLEEEYDRLADTVQELRDELSDQNDELKERETKLDLLRAILDGLVTELQVADSLEEFQQIVVDLKWLSY